MVVTVRFFIHMATVFYWPLQQLDANNALLHRFLHDEIYMMSPQGYKKANPRQVCKLL